MRRRRVTSDHWAIRTRRRQLTTAACVLVVCLFDLITSWSDGDTVNGVIGGVGVVLCAALFVATLLTRA